MIAFLFLFSVAYVAATFLASGIGHLARFGDLMRSLREHAILPVRAVAPAAGLLTVFELAAAVLATRAVLRGGAGVMDVMVLAACALAGTGFVLYLRRLLGTSRSADCACLPLRAPLTPLSLAPGSGIALVAMVGLACGLVLAQPAAVLQQLAPLSRLLPPAWGVTLAGLVMMLPASLPWPRAEAHP